MFFLTKIMLHHDTSIRNVSLFALTGCSIVTIICFQPDWVFTKLPAEEMSEIIMFVNAITPYWALPVEPHLRLLLRVWCIAGAQCKLPLLCITATTKVGVGRKEGRKEGGGGEVGCAHYLKLSWMPGVIIWDTKIPLYLGLIKRSCTLPNFIEQNQKFSWMISKICFTSV